MLLAQTYAKSDFRKKHFTSSRICKVMGVEVAGSKCASIFSEDYYGDLDLKAIRKSELYAGLQQSDAQGPHSQQPKLKPRPQKESN